MSLGYQRRIATIIWKGYKILLSFLTTYLYEAGFSYETTYGNKMNADEYIRIQLSSVKADIGKETYKNIKQMSLISLSSFFGKCAHFLLKILILESNRFLLLY